jgi:hypothetical protein
MVVNWLSLSGQGWRPVSISSTVQPSDHTSALRPACACAWAWAWRANGQQACVHVDVCVSRLVPPRGAACVHTLRPQPGSGRHTGCSLPRQQPRTVPRAVDDLWRHPKHAAPHAPHAVCGVCVHVRMRVCMCARVRVCMCVRDVGKRA